MIVDEIQITIRAGKGGDGAVSFRREKYVPRGGPDGGNGGDGGSVYLIGVSDLSALRQFKHKKEIVADSGDKGMGRKKSGKAAHDIYVPVPIGTSIKDIHSQQTWTISNVDETICIAKGGKGGKGSFELRSNRNKAPLVAEKGTLGESREVILLMQFIADIGLIGLPSVGKSSLLNALTHAEARVGDYPFTTLEPNLGSMEGIIIADIPGLIEGAHSGKGLGVKFLKHIEKTKLLAHCIEATSPHPLEDYRSIRSELEQFNPELLHKKEIIVMTKSDLVEPDKIKKCESELKKLNKNVIICSIIDDTSLLHLKKVFLNQI